MKCVLLLLGLVALAHAAPLPIPNFPQSFTMVETDTIAMYQGDYYTQGDNYCCPTDGNCEVQTQYQTGKYQIDAKNQQIRYDPAGQAEYIVTIFADGKEYGVQNGVCQSYCPLDGEEFGSFGVDPNATYIGNKIINGIDAAGYQWNETAFGVIVMQVSTMWVNMNVNPPIALEEIDLLTPFGQQVGGQSSVWTQWSYGVPPASAFEFSGKASCPEDQNCNSDSRQASRLRAKLYRTWYKSYQAKQNSLSQARRSSRRRTKLF